MGASGSVLEAVWSGAELAVKTPAASCVGCWKMFPASSPLHWGTAEPPVLPEQGLLSSCRSHAWSTAWRSPTLALVSVNDPLAGYPRCSVCSVKGALVSQDSVDGVLSLSVVLQVVEMAPHCAVSWTAECVSLQHW